MYVLVRYCWHFGFLLFSEIIIENNPYEGYFNEAELKKLVGYIDVGQTADAIELGVGF